ncbi:hypothetical protein V8319_004293 [Escherichia coli]|nr:hypothetical protein [Escherichia coli]EHC7952005.1 hypothetical protein [Escherichia coli]
MKKKIKLIVVPIVLSFFVMEVGVSRVFAGGYNENELMQFQDGVNEVHAEASRPGASDKIKELSGTLRKLQKQSQEYESAKLNSWVYGELAKCKVITEAEYQDYFLRFMRSKYPNYLNLVSYDGQVINTSTTQVYFERFIKEEVTPKARDYYVDERKCPRMQDLNFGF